MPFSFPASPSVGDQSTQNGRTYSWSGYAWEIVATPASLPASVITSGTLDIARIPLATTGAAGAMIVGSGLSVSSNGTVNVMYGVNGGTACQGNDARLSDSRTPTGAAGGDLTGTYPNPTIAAGAIVTADLSNDAVTYAKIQNVSATDRLLGRSSAGAGDVEEITCTAFGRSLIDDADAAAARTTLSVQPTASPAFTGTATFTNTGNFVPLTVNNTGTANSFVVNDDGSGDTTPFVIDASGNVGIGVSSPTHKIDCGGEFRLRGTGPSSEAGKFHLYYVSDTNRATITTGSSGEIIVETGVSSPATRLTISSTGTATFAGQVLVTAGSGSAGSYKPGVAISGDDDTGIHQVSGNANTLSIVTGGSERVRVDASGNVGIGLTSAQVRLHCVTASDGAQAIFSGAQSGNEQTLLFRNPFFTNNASAGLAAIGWIDTGSSGGILTLKTTTNGGGASGTPTERVRIGNDGKVTFANVYDTTVGGTNRDLFIDSGGLIGYVSSIRESKTDIVALDDVSWLSALSPVSYRYRKRNSDNTYSDEADGVTDYGLIAEDVEAVRPELCFYDMVDGEPQLRGVTYSKLITPMLRYIQQLEQRIAALEERLNHA